ncbi:MAG: MptD family putative ECF transporter S component [Lachnospiraceae bacterium]
MNVQKNSNHLNGKDLINVGVFTAVNLVIAILIATTVGLIPVGLLLINVITPLVSGIPMMLFYSRVKKFGMLMIMAIVNGVTLILTGTGPYTLISGVIFSFLAELILKSGNYSSVNRAILAFAVSSISSASSYLQWMDASSDWIEKQTAAYGEIYTVATVGYFSHWWMLPLLVLATFISCILGGLLGKAVLKKHFIRSGLL